MIQLGFPLVKFMLNSDQIKLITYKIGETITENRDIREIRENKNTLVPNKKNLSVIKKKKVSGIMLTNKEIKYEYLHP